MWVFETILPSHSSLIFSHRCSASRLQGPWKLSARCTGKLIRILLSRTTSREEKKKEGKPPLEGQHMARLAEPFSYGFWSFGDERGRRSWVYLTLVPSLSAPEDFLRKDTRPSLHLFPSFVETLLTKRATIPRSIPPSALELSFGIFRNDYRYGRRWPNIRVNPSVKLKVLREEASENRIFFRIVRRKFFSRENVLQIIVKKFLSESDLYVYWNMFLWSIFSSLFIYTVIYFPYIRINMKNN